jgi:NAD(P)-dependent dehydrogenase (short-subunit alcohol dehydrogenase family)
MEAARAGFHRVHRQQGRHRRLHPRPGGGARASGITVNAIAPGLTRSPGAEEGNTAEHFEDVRRVQAVRRSVLPTDMAGAVAFLASDDAAMITGQTIRIDGGLVTL